MSSINKKFNYEGKRWGITPITSTVTNFQGLELTYFVSDIPNTLKNKSISLVDLGCGGGNIVNYLKGVFPKWRITGIDIAKDAISLAKSNFPKIDFVRTNASHLPAKDESVDILTGFDTFEHFENLQSVLEEAKRVLKVGGILYVAIPLEKQFPSAYWLMYLFGWRGKNKFAGHVNFFNKQEFKNLLENTGFKLNRVRYSNHFLFSVFDLAYYLSQSLLGKQATSFESTVGQLTGPKGAVLSLIKKTISAITFYESKLLSHFPGGKGHFVFEKIGDDFFSGNPPVTVLEDFQTKYGLSKVLRPKEIRIRQLLDKFEFNKAKTVLDFGTANGIWLERLLAGNNKKGYGVDIAEELIKFANSRKNKKGQYFWTSQKWPIKKNSMDICVSFDVFEHIKDKRHEAQKIYSSLKPGGKFLIYAIHKNNMFTFDWFFEKLGNDALYKRADHHKEIFVEPDEFAKTLEDIGFKNVKYELFDGPANLFWDVACYAYLGFTEHLLTSLRLPKLLDAFVSANDSLINTIYPFNKFIDNIFFKTGNSNGVFIWGEK